jgi:hypothetical protein
MNLDETIYSAAEIAELAQTDILNVHTWTSRGFSDPYHAKRRVRRGRGRPRSYSLRDGLRFFLMARLHKQYRTPLPQGLQLCQLVFGAENFDPDCAAYLVMTESTSEVIDAEWCEDLAAVGRRLAVEPLATVIHVKRILDTVSGSARRLHNAGKCSWQASTPEAFADHQSQEHL